MSEHYKFVNEPLPYTYDAMEPYIDTKTMQLHHNRHLQTYIDNLNGVLKEYPALQKLSLEQLIVNVMLFPSEIQVPILNNAGGVYNHQFYFAGLTKPGKCTPGGVLADYINMIFGSYANFQEAFTKEALSIFGSGYAWLVADRYGLLKILSTPNQDIPSPLNYCPILNLDVWEHAYYLKHYNKRADYIKDWFAVINWDRANKNFLIAMDGESFYGLEMKDEYM